MSKGTLQSKKKSENCKTKKTGALSEQFHVTSFAANEYSLYNIPHMFC